MTAGRGMARRSLFTTGPSASTISALRSITSLRARRAGTMVSGSNEALSAGQRKGLPRCAGGRLAQGSSQAATYATQPAKARQDLGLSPSTLGECGAQRLQLLHHRPPRGPPRGGAALHRVLPRSQLGQRRGQRGMDAGGHRPGHAIERDPGALRLTDQPTHQAVALAERHAGLHQEVREVRSAQRGVERGPHPLGIDAQRGDCPGRGGEYQCQSVESVEQQRLVLLEVLAVSRRSPFRVVSNATRSPSSRPDFARASSKMSGLRFCGSRLEPVLKSSDSRTKPNSALVYNTISAARRERWVPTRVRANKTSATKSRSPVASRAFAETERKPSASFRSTRSTANPDPARAPDPSGSSATRRRASARRWRSRTSGHACASSTYAQRTGWARWPCV